MMNELIECLKEAKTKHEVLACFGGYSALGFGVVPITVGGVYSGKSPESARVTLSRLPPKAIGVRLSRKALNYGFSRFPLRGRQYGVVKFGRYGLTVRPRR